MADKYKVKKLSDFPEAKSIDDLFTLGTDKDNNSVKVPIGLLRGNSPYIGANGNWWVGTVDTGIEAQGIPGEDGGIQVLNDGDTLSSDGEYLMFDDGTVTVLGDGYSTVDIPASELNVSGYINEDGSFKSSGAYSRTNLRSIPEGTSEFEFNSFDGGSVARPIAFYNASGQFVSSPANIGFNTVNRVSRPANATQYALCKHNSFSYATKIIFGQSSEIINDNAIVYIEKKGNSLITSKLRDFSAIGNDSIKIVKDGDIIKEDGSYLMMSSGTLTLPKFIEELNQAQLNLIGALMPDGTTNTATVYYHTDKNNIPDQAIGIQVLPFPSAYGARSLGFYNSSGAFISTINNSDSNKPVTVDFPTNAKQYILCRNTGLTFSAGFIYQSKEYTNTNKIILIEVKQGIASVNVLHDFTNTETKTANRPKAFLKDFLLNGSATASNTVNITGTGATTAMHLKYKAYLSAEKLTFAVAFKANAASSIRIGRHLGGCIKIDGNTLTVYRLNSALSDYEVHETFTLPFTITTGNNYLVSCDKIDLLNLRYSISNNSGQTFSVIYNKKIVEASKRSVAIAWGTPFFGVVSGDVTVNNAMLLSRYDFITLLSIFGDSFIEGTSLIDLGIKDKWSTKVAELVGEQYVHISGKGGEVADAAFVSRFKVENSLFKSPYVVLALGTNHSSLASYTTYMQQLIDECRTNAQIPILQTIPPRQGINYTTVTKSINDWVRSSGELFLDFHAALTRGDGSLWKGGYVLSDGVHPSIAGHEAMFEQAKKDLSFLF